MNKFGVFIAYYALAAVIFVGSLYVAYKTGRFSLLWLNALTLIFAPSEGDRSEGDGVNDI